MKSSPVKRLKPSPFSKIEGGVDTNPDEDVKTEESSTTSAGENIADFLTPDNPLIAMLDVLSGGVGGKGLSKYLTKTKMGKKLVKKIPSLSKLLEKTPSAKNQPVDFTKTKSFTGGVDAGDVKWKKDLHMGSGPKVVEFKLNEMKSIGKNLDEMNFDATKLTPKDVKFRGIIGDRSVVEVKLPTGQTQLFYKSTDYSGKGVEDMWQAYGGHADTARTKGWFIKDEGFKNFYDSKSFRDISGNLDRIAVEGDFQKHIDAGQGYASKRK
tara:strand:+ start:67 stop:867 length:801 start_codon:yes stop_codon:yes gene_type:complete